MARERVIAVYLVLFHTFYNVVFRIAVGKAVGHNQVKHVFGSESLYVAPLAHTLLQFVRDSRFLFPLSQDDIECLCGSIRQVKIKKKIIRAVLPYGFFQDDVLACNRNRRRSDVLAIKHDLKLGIFHS